MSKRGKIYLFFFIVAVLAFVARAFFLFKEFPLKYHIVSFFISFFVMTFFYETIQFIHTQLNKYLPFQKNMALRLIAQFSLSLIFIMLYTTILLYFILDYVPIAVDRIVTFSFYAIYIIVTMLVNSILIASHFFSEWKNTLLLSAELEKEKTRVQYDNLKNQLNPHFLFNSLTSLDSLIYKDPQLASAFLQQLSKIYRYVLQHKETNLVEVKEELNFVSNYIELLKTRFGKGLIIEMNISEKSSHKMIVPVSLQIMIENAIKHNSTGEEAPLYINIKDEQEYLWIRNSLSLKKQVESSNKQGLENFKKLYSLFTEKEVEVVSEKDSFLVKIPLI
jgi:two-component system LytT family sensor kinase